MSYIIYDYLLPGINQNEVILKRLHRVFLLCHSITLLTSDIRQRGGEECDIFYFPLSLSLSLFLASHPSLDRKLRRV